MQRLSRVAVADEMSNSTISTFQLFALFPDEDTARVYLEDRLWPKGPMKNTLSKLTEGQRDELIRYTDRMFYAAIHEGFDSKSAGEMAAKAAERKAKEMVQVSK